MHLRLAGLWWLTLVAALGLSGCKRLSTGAREHFAQALSCPEERVTVKAREDLNYAQLVEKAVPVEVPSDEVKKDPERMAKWRHDQEQLRGQRAAMSGGIELFEVTGCEHRQLLRCAHPVGGSDNSAQSDLVSCFEVPAGLVPGS